MVYKHIISYVTLFINIGLNHQMFAIFLHLNLNKKYVFRVGGFFACDQNTLIVAKCIEKFD